MRQKKKQRVHAVGIIDGHLNMRQCAERFGVSYAWLCQHKEIPSLRIGKRRYFHEAELMAFFKRQSMHHE